MPVLESMASSTVITRAAEKKSKDNTMSMAGVPTLSAGQVARGAFVTGTSPFTQAQLALALTIQKSKPNSISTKEYCLRLRKHVKLDKPPTADEHHFIDSVAYWKSQCSKLHDEKSALQDKVVRLEDQCGSLQQQSDLLQHQRIVLQNQCDGLQQQRDCLRRQRDDLEQERDDLEEQLDDLEHDFDGLEQQVESSNEARVRELLEPIEGAQSSQLSRKRKAQALDDDISLITFAHKLQQAYHATYLHLMKNRGSLLEHFDLHLDSAAPHMELLEIIKATAKNMEFFILRAYNFLLHNPSHVEKIGFVSINSFEVPYVVKFFSESFDTCLTALDHLCRNVVGRRNKGQAIYALVHVFVVALNTFQSLCSREVVGEGVIGSEDSDQPQIPGPGPLSALHKDKLIKLMFSFFDRMFIASTLDFTENSFRAEVLEGLVSALLKRLGSLLSKRVFHEEIASSTYDGHISMTTDQPFPFEKMNAVELEGCQLTLLLRRANQRMENQIQSSDHYLVSYNGSTMPSMEKCMLPKLRQKMQATLLKAAFGNEGQEYLESLREPIYAEPESPVMDPAEIAAINDRGFVEQLWSTLGWEPVMEGM